MRISTFQIYRQGVDAMLRQQADLAKTQQQMATGKNILAPSDDPGAASRVLELGQLIDVNKQYQRNAEAARANLSLQESVLQQVGNLLQRVRELAVRANNDTLSAGDRGAIAAEVRTRLDELLQAANTRDASGDYLFAGFRSHTAPFSSDGSGNFSYNGDQGQRLLQVGPTRKVAANDPGDAVFMGIDDGAGGVSDMFSVLYDFAADLDANNPSASTLDRLDAAIDAVLTTRASIGARLNSIDSQQQMNDAFDLQLRQNRSTLEDLDYAEAVSRFERQNIALQAAQQSFIKIEGLSLFKYL